MNPFDLALNSYASESDTNDSEILNGEAPAALEDAVNFAMAVQAEFGAGQIFVTGHSLGGVEAEAVAAADGQGGLSIAGGATFGAPGLPGYSGGGNATLMTNFINYVDFGDPVGNYASDVNSELDLAFRDWRPFWTGASRWQSSRSR